LINSDARTNSTNNLIIGAKAEAGSAIGALEDNDDNDDTATGIAGMGVIFQK